MFVWSFRDKLNLFSILKLLHVKSVYSITLMMDIYGSAIDVSYTDGTGFKLVKILLW